MRKYEETPDLILKTISIISFVFIALALFSIRNSVATGYELSIFSSTPVLAWVFLFGSLAGGISIIVQQAFTNKKSNYWMIGFLIIIIGNFTFLSLPLLKGYFLYASPDALAHLAFAEDIASSGHLGDNNVYPTVHILLVQMADICNVSLPFLMRLLPGLFSVLFMIYVCFLARIVLPKEGQVLLALGASAALLFNNLHLMIYPHTFSYLFLPLILYLYFRSIDSSYRGVKMLLIVLLLFIPFAHFTTSFLLIFFLVAAIALRVIARKSYPGSSWRPSVMPIIILLTIFVVHNLYLAMSPRTFGSAVRSSVTSVVQSLKPLSPAQPPPSPAQPPPSPPLYVRHLEDAKSTLQGLPKIDVANLLFRMHGDSILYVLLSTIGAFIIIRGVLYRRRNLDSLCMVSVIFLISIPLGWVIFMGTGMQTVGRFLNVNAALFATPLLVGFVLYHFLKGSRMAVGLSAVLLTGVFMASALGVYHSPWILQPSWHITLKDIDGTEWFSEHKDKNLPFITMGYWAGFLDKKALPDHFGYDRHQFLRESLTEDRYLILSRRFILASANQTLARKGLFVPPYFWRGFSPGDFDKLEGDPSVRRVYSNGGTDLLYVRGGGSPK